MVRAPVLRSLPPCHARVDAGFQRLDRAFRDGDCQVGEIGLGIAVRRATTGGSGTCLARSSVHLSLLRIPVIIEHGTMLSLEEYGRWHTSAAGRGASGRREPTRS